MTPEQQKALRAAQQRMAIQAAQERLRSEFPQPPSGVSTNSDAVDDFRRKGTALVDGLHNGATAGFGENLSGVRGAVFGQNLQPDGTTTQDYSGTMGERYARERDKRRDQLAQSREAEPTAYTGGNIIGAGAVGMATAPMATGPSLLNTMGRGALIGGIEGGLHGAGNADGENVGKEAMKGAAIGAGIGAAAPAVVRGASAVKRAMADPVSGLLGIGNKSRANRAIMQTLQGSGQSPDDVGKAVMRAAQEGQPEYRVMDALGVSGQRRASGIARAGGDPGTDIAEYLAKRQAGQGERVASFVDDGFGLNGSTADQIKDGLKASRKSAADTAYDAARGNAAPVDVRGAVAVIDDRIGGMKGSNIAGDSIDGRLAKYRQRLAADPAPDGEISRELSDFNRVLGVKQSVQDDIGAAVRAGRNNEARELGKLLSELDSALEQSSDMYRTANDGFRVASQNIDAIDQGAQMSRPSVRAGNSVQQFQGMTPDQQSAARVGYGDKLMAQIENNSSPTSNRAKPLQSPKRVAEADAMTVDPELYSRRLARESDMWETQNRALGGSRTADNLEDIADTSEIASGMGGAVRSLANLQFGDAATKAVGAVAPMAKGQNEATRQLIAKALMSNNPQEALAPALRQNMRSENIRRLLEAMLRNAGRDRAAPLLP